MTAEFRKLLSLSDRYLIDKPLMVGGMPRDYVLGVEKKTFDYDITTNNPDSIRLGVLFSDETGRSFKLFQEGNLKVMFDNYSYDFSSNFESEGVINFLKKEKSILDRKYFEAYSRDFTMNTLQQDLLNKEIIDLTNVGIKDLQEGIIKTPVPAEITISDDPRRIFRAINFAARYNMKVDYDIINFVRNNKKDIFEGPTRPKDSFIVSKVGESINEDSDITMELLVDMDILSQVPLEGSFKNEIVRRKMVLEYLG